ncbi:methyltransferase, partial [Sphaerisporangium sp. NPDC049002]|uniref:methyltransferase n=1 Tax=Sphaerisporangium sp. NPDC049002 TaxID=3155392 RepID=UPI0033D738AC
PIPATGCRGWRSYHRVEAFFTPPALAEQVVAAADIQPGMTVLEPSAGNGALAALAAERGGLVHAVELYAPFAERLRRLGLQQVTVGDFMDLTPAQHSQRYDRVVMNPPFRRGTDVLHVMRAMRFLKPDGLLVAVMSAGLADRQTGTAVHLRSLVALRGGRIEYLPEGAFVSAGTGVRTILVTIPGAGPTP